MIKYSSAFFCFGMFLRASSRSSRRNRSRNSSGRFREGDGGMHPSPTSLKVTISAEKSASIWNNSAPFGDASPPHQSEPNDFGRKITLNFGEDLFFLFWRPPDFGRKKPLNLRFRPKNHSQSR